jgi:hypothetical protein
MTPLDLLLLLGIAIGGPYTVALGLVQGNLFGAAIFPFSMLVATFVVFTPGVLRRLSPRWFGLLLVTIFVIERVLMTGGVL